MNKREKTIAICVGAAVGLLALDQWLLGPYFTRLSKADDLIARHQSALSDGNTVLQTRLRASKHWRDIAAGKVTADASAAESQLLNRVRDCAQRANLQLTSLKSEKSEKEKGYERVSVKPTGTGSMGQIGRFLYELKMTTDMPVRVNDIQIISRKDGADDLSVSLALSTIYQAVGQAKVAMNGSTGAFQ
ncbi:MAG TPA: GspMb/PilO family protein [Tepidisphaeraceae bacterium]|jgi:hypothetical protein